MDVIHTPQMEFNLFPSLALQMDHLTFILELNPQSANGKLVKQRWKLLLLTRCAPIAPFFYLDFSRRVAINLGGWGGVLVRLVCDPSTGF